MPATNTQRTKFGKWAQLDIESAPWLIEFGQLFAKELQRKNNAKRKISDVCVNLLELASFLFENCTGVAGVLVPILSR
jgi:hypothetical protein